MWRETRCKHTHPLRGTAWQDYSRRPSSSSSISSRAADVRVVVGRPAAVVARAAGAAAVPAVFAVFSALCVAVAGARVALACSLQLPPLVVLLQCCLARPAVALERCQGLELPALLTEPVNNEEREEVREKTVSGSVHRTCGFLGTISRVKICCTAAKPVNKEETKEKKAGE
jgi:hypothetical protein